MSRVSTHALDRAMQKFSTGGVLGLDAKRQAAGFDQLQEIEHQFQVPISGTARSGAGWSTVEVQFEVTFVFAPEQRYSPFTVPHFTYGVAVSGEPAPDPNTPDPNNPESLVAVTCQVIEWAKNLAADAIIGAHVGIGVSTLGGLDVDFTGYAHLTFQGYGAPTEDTPASIDVGA